MDLGKLVRENEPGKDKAAGTRGERGVGRKGRIARELKGSDQGRERAEEEWKRRATGGGGKNKQERSKRSKRSKRCRKSSRSGGRRSRRISERGRARLVALCRGGGVSCWKKGFEASHRA